MKLKTSELKGKALDYAVAVLKFPEPDYTVDERLIYIRGGYDFFFSPSVNWTFGGPIIEQHQMQLTEAEEGGWEASTFSYVGRGETQLIAAMRCYVASRLGDEVEVPDELIGETNENT